MTTYHDRRSGFIAGVAYKTPVAAATTANIALSGLQTVDGVSLASGDRVLVKNQTSSVDNGVWVASSGAWTRAADFDGADDVVQGSQVLVTSGTTNGGLAFRLATSAPVIGSTSLAFSAVTVENGLNAVTPTGGSADSLPNHLAALYAGELAVTPAYGTVSRALSMQLPLRPDHFSSLEDMAASGGKHFVVPAGLASSMYEFGAPLAFPAGTRLEVEPGVELRPTFEATGTDRETPYITAAAGFICPYLNVQLDAGLDTVRTLLEIGDYAQLGHYVAQSVDLNNNRTESGSTDVVSGALVIRGDHVRVGSVFLDRFDAGWAVIDSTDVVLSKIRNQETVRGGYVRGTRDLHILSGHTTGPTDPTEPNPFRRGIMTPGANSLVLAGCSDSSFSNWSSFDILEHAIRVGSIASGTTVPNHRVEFSGVRSYRPYGCGFKMDDGDRYNIKYISIRGLYTEDVGRGNWFGTAGYSNWSADGTDSPGDNNDGNKQACAIRNSEVVQLIGFMNRAKSQAESGYNGLWVERSNDVQVADIDTANSREDGVVVQSGEGRDINIVSLRGVRTKSNAGHGLLFDPVDTSDAVTWRGVSATDIDAQTNGGDGVKVNARGDGSTPFATLASRVEGISKNNAGANKNIAANVASDPDFIDDVSA